MINKKQIFTVMCVFGAKPWQNHSKTIAKSALLWSLKYSDDRCLQKKTIANIAFFKITRVHTRTQAHARAHTHAHGNFSRRLWQKAMVAMVFYYKRISDNNLSYHSN